MSYVLTYYNPLSLIIINCDNAHLPEERAHVAKTKGVCSSCGLSTHKITPFRSIPKDNEFVENGICLKCHPDRRKCNRNNRPSQATRIGNGKSSKVLGIDDDISSLVHSTKMAKRIKNRATHARKATSDVSRQVLAKSLIKKDQSFIANNSRTLSDPAATNQRQTIADAKPWKSLKDALHHKNDARSVRSVNRRTSRHASGGSGNYRRRSSESDIPALKKAKLKRLSQRSKTFGDHPKKEYTIDVWDIVKEMRLHPNNPQLLAEKCNDLRDKAINQAGSLYEQIDVMRRFPNESKLQIACIGGLWSVSAEGGDDGKAEVRDAGGAGDIIAAMKCFPDNIDVLSHGLGTLSCLCSGYGGRSYLVDDEDIVLLLENILKRFADKEGEERGQVLYWVLVCLNSIISDYGDIEIFSNYQESQQQPLDTLDTSNRSTESYNSVQSSSFEESGKGWECEGCSMLNTTKVTQCEMCGNERDSQQKESSTLDKEIPTQHQVDYDAVEEECNVTERSRDAVANSQIISLVLQATNEVPVDGITLELALYFLAHFEEKQCESLRTLLADACKRAVQMPQEAFPILHQLACAIQCLTMNLEESVGDQETAKCFADTALDSLVYGAERHSSDIPQSPRRSSTTHSTSSSTYSTSSEAGTRILYKAKVQEVFLSLLSNLLYFGSVKLDSIDSEDLLDICCTALEDEGSSVFLLTVCYWIIWSIITYGPKDIKQSSLDVMDGILHTISNLEHSPTALTLGFAVIAEVVHCNDLEIDSPQVIEMIARIVSKYPIEMLQKEAFQLLFLLCKSKEDAVRIVNTGVLNYVNKAVCDSAQPCQLATNLLIKLSVLAEDNDDDDDILSIDDLQSIVSASFALKSSSLLAAKNWVQFLTSSIKSKKDVGQQSLLMALSSITEIMESFPNNLEVQKMTCLALTDVAVSAKQEVDVSDQIIPILNLQKVHGLEIHKECCDALWALMRIRHDLNVDLLREVIYFAIEVTEIHVVCPEYSFSNDVVTAGIAIVGETLTDPQILGEMLVDIMVDVLNKCIYSYLDREEDVLSVFEHGFCALQRLCNDDSCRDIVITHGGIVAVVDGMVAHSTNASIQQNGCHILWRLGENETDELEVKLRILEADGVDVLLNVMITHGDNGGVLAEAFRALSSLCVDKSSRNFVTQQGGVMMITTSLSTLPKDVHVQESGLAALCNLTSLDVDESLIDASTISSVVHKSLECHDNVISIQQKGLSLLYNLSLRSEGIRDILLSSSCLKNVSRALELHVSSPQVISAAIALLISLSDTEECTRFLLKKEAMNRIVQSMMMNVEDLQVSIVCFNFLHLACEKNINNMGIGGVEAVVCTMKIRLSSEYIQDTGCRILAHLSTQSFMSFMWSGSSLDVDFFDLTCAIVDVIVSAIEGYHRNFQVQQHGINTLINVSKYDGNTPVLFTEQSRIEDVLAEASGRFPELKAKCDEVLQVFLT